MAALAETMAAALTAGASLRSALDVSLAALHSADPRSQPATGSGSVPVAPAAASECAGQHGNVEVESVSDALSQLGRAQPGCARSLSLLVACTRLAEDHGAPPAVAVGRAAELIRARQSRERLLHTLAAGPRASMGMLSALPLLGPLIIALVGLDVAKVYAGWIAGGSVLVGVLLALAGRLWAGRLLHRALRERQIPLARGGSAEVSDVVLALALVALVLRSGGGSVDALDAVAEVPECRAGPDLATVAAALRWGVPAADAWLHVDGVWRPAAALWQVAAELGAAPASLLEAAATRIELSEAARAAASAQRAGVHLVLPLGLCFLPGFVVTTVVPVIIHLGRQLAG